MNKWSAGGEVAVLAKRLQDEGLVVLPNPIEADLVGQLRDAFLEILAPCIEVADANRGSSRHQMYLPFEPPFDAPALWGNPAVLAVIEEALGSDFDCIYFASDTPSLGSRYQRMHRDSDPLFALGDAHLPLYGVDMNVTLVDVDDQNGPFEW